MREHNDRVSHAWTLAALMRTSARQKLPPLKTLFARPRRRAAQSWQEQAEAAKAWVAAFGGRIIEQSKLQ